MIVISMLFLVVSWFSTGLFLFFVFSCCLGRWCRMIVLESSFVAAAATCMCEHWSFQTEMPLVRYAFLSAVLCGCHVCKVFGRPKRDWDSWLPFMFLVVSWFPIGLFCVFFMLLGTAAQDDNLGEYFCQCSSLLHVQAHASRCKLQAHASTVVFNVRCYCCLVSCVFACRFWCGVSNDRFLMGFWRVVQYLDTYVSI